MENKIDCPYCGLAKKRGGLYCSKHTSEITTLKSGIFLISQNKIEECDWHYTRLSLNFNLDEAQLYRVGGHEYKVSPEKYLLINNGQWFKTHFNGKNVSRMLTIAYKVGLAEQIHYAFTHTEQYLLDNPEGTSSLFLPDQTLPMNQDLYNEVSGLCSDYAAIREGELQEHLENVLAFILTQQLHDRKEVNSIRRVRLATKQEIYRRLQWSIEYIDENFASPINIDHLAGVACLSPFHFKRVFKQAFSHSPYQYIKIKRIEMAKRLLGDGYPVHEVCKMVGWDDPSSFIRTFKKAVELTPKKYRIMLR